MVVLLGIMTRVFLRTHLDEVIQAVCSAGLASVQLNLSSAGLETLPAELSQDQARRIGDAFSHRGLTVAAVSGSFNTIHPDRSVRSEGIRRFKLLASRSRALGTRVITVCTGTRDPTNPWKPHPANRDPQAWRDLVETIRQLLDFAEQQDVTLAFEPETANVVDSSRKARMLIEEMKSDRLRVLLDPANLVTAKDLKDTRPVLESAFADLGPYIVMVHAKDVVPEDHGWGGCRRVAAGRGLLDYRLFFALLKAVDFRGSVILHDLREEEVAETQTWLRTVAGGAF
ncbi:MAG: sugar phosphate isomerase/epimerase family protein [Acidobacteriota bacterium]